MTEEGLPDIITGEMCPFCREKTLTLAETERDVPFFGKVYLFSMDCESCDYHKADLEMAETPGKKVKFTLDITSEEDMKIRVVKSSSATVKIGRIGTMEPGDSANGYITNVEGILNRMKKQLEIIRDEADDNNERKTAKNHLKKLTRVMWGQDTLKLVIDDPNGNSAIVSEKAVKG